MSMATDMMSPMRRITQGNQQVESGLLENPNDDQNELLARQQELLQELRAQHRESPGTPGRKIRKSMGLGPTGLTDWHLAEHYANCIRLANENKITTKNAFSLHLIDHLSEVLDFKNGKTDFQSASCTLDASAKIYAHRVDRIHSEAFAIAGGLGAISKPKKSEDKENEDPQKEVEAEATKKAPKGKSGSTLVRNPKTITSEKVETVKCVDVLLESIRANKVEGTTDSFFLSNMCFRNDTGELLSDFSPMAEPDATWYNLVKTPRDLLQNILHNRMGICPDDGLCHLWNSHLGVEQQRCSDTLECSDVRVNDTTGPDLISEPAGEMMPSFCDNEDIRDCGDAVLHDDDDFYEDCPPEKLTRLDNSPDVTRFLAPVPGDYSYFTKPLSSAPAGPEFWRLRLANRGKPTVPEKGRRKAEKVVPLLDIDQLVSDPAFFTRPARESVLNKSTLASWKASRFLLPQDWYGGSLDLGSFILSKERKLTKIATTCSPEVTEAPGDFGYEANDDNFCPDVNEDSNMSIEEAAAAQSVAVVEDEEVAPFPDFTTNVSFVPKTAKPQIQFSRVIKRFDMGQMKRAMWETLTSGIESQENMDTDSEAAVSPSGGKRRTFSGMYKDLPAKLNSLNRENISIPVAFCAVLHLAAEKGIYLFGREDFSDVDIKLP